MPFVAGQTALPPAPAAPIPPPIPEPADDWQPFVPGPVQRAILDALDGKSLHARALGAAVGDVSRLYRPKGLQELRDRGMVEKHDRLGFWRPDAPPPEISEEISEENQTHETQ